jgi:parvulin-like peptidyl-prolyl isomerase
VTRVLPLPVAKAGSAWVSYESYLFELRHYMHYYETQQQINFNSASGKEQLVAFRKQALEQVINDAYTKQIAAQQHISVSNSDVNDAVALLREQNRLGSSDQEFSDVLKEFWGWSVDDFKRELRQQLLAQKVIATLGTATNTRANQALAELKGGQKFEAVAKKYSDDAATKANGGEYGSPIDHNNRDLAPQVVDELFKLKPGQISGVIDTGYTLEIVKVVSVSDGKVRAAHIAFNYQGITTYIKPQEAKHPAHRFISVK